MCVTIFKIKYSIMANLVSSRECPLGLLDLPPQLLGSCSKAFVLLLILVGKGRGGNEE